MITLKKTACSLLLTVALLIFPTTGALANMYFHDGADGSLEYFITNHDTAAQQYNSSYGDLGIKTAVFLGFATSNYDTFTRDSNANPPFFATGDDHSAFGSTFSYVDGGTPANSFFSRYKKSDGSLRDSSWLGSSRTQAWQLSQDFTITYNGQTLLLKQGDIVVGYEDWGDSDYNDMVVLLTTRESSAVPIPGAVWLLGSGVIGLGIIRRRKQT